MSKTLRLLFSLLVLIFLASVQLNAQGQGSVTGVSVSGTIIGGSTQTASATITVVPYSDGTPVLVYVSADYVCGGGFLNIPGAQATITLTGCVGVNQATTAHVTATSQYVAGSSATGTLTVLPFELSLSVSGNVIGGTAQTGTATVSLNAPSLAGTPIAISSTGYVLVPTVISVHANETSATFSVSGYQVLEPEADSIHVFWGTVTASADITLQPIKVTSLNVGMTSDTTGEGTIAVNAAPLSGVGVNLSVDRDFTVPPLVLMPSGQTSTTFQFAGSPGADTATFTASLSGHYPQTATLDGGTPDKDGDDCSKCSNPINVMNGNVWVQESDYSIPGLGGGLSLARRWNSLWAGETPVELVGMFGHSWRSNFEERLQTLTGGITRYWLANGNFWKYSYDTLNGVYHLEAPLDQHASLTVDSITAQRTITFLDGSKKIFNSGGYLVASLDRNANQTSISYDANNRITQVTDAANRSLTFNYASPTSHLVSTVQDAAGVVATYTYDGSSRLLNVTYADSSAVNFAYDAGSRMTSVTDKDGKVLEVHTYDSRGRGLTSSSANGVELVSVSYTASGSTRLTDSAGRTTDYGYAAVAGRHHINAISGSGCSSCSGRGVNSFVFDTNGNRTSSTDALSHTTSMTYDALGNLTSRSVPLNASTTLTNSYTYNGFGEVLTATGPLGNTTSNTYDAKGNLLSTTTPAPGSGQSASTTTFTYDVKGQLTTVIDPLSHVTTMTYTPAGLVATISDAQSNVTHLEYDARGNRTAVVDAAGNRTAFTYDSRNRLTRTTQADTTHTDFAYDTRGRRTSVTDANGNTTSYAYDDADRLTSVTDASNNVTAYAYDNENDLLSITDALNRVTSFQYDALGRVTKTVFPLSSGTGTGLSETYNYDQIGNLLSKVDRKAKTTTFTYDVVNRLTRKQYDDGTGINYTYDAGSRLTQASDASGTYNSTYDNLARLTGTTTQYSLVPGHTFTMAYAYDVNGNRASMTDPQNGTTAYVYDVLNRINSLSNPQQQQFNFAYDNLGRRVSLTRPNTVSTAYEYDSLSRLLSITHGRGTGSPIDGAIYILDNAGNRLTKANIALNRVMDMGYDSINQLTNASPEPCFLDGVCPPPPPPPICLLDENCPQPVAAGTESYSYDKVGNRIGSLPPNPPVMDNNFTNLTYNSSNQLISSDDGISYTYDNNGNRLTRTDPNGTTSYAWDFENRLKSVTLPDNSTVTFKYDPFGRRIQKSSAAGTTNYIYDGANIVEEVDSSGTVLAKYTHGLGVDEPLAILRDNATYYYHADGLGTITALTDASGEIANSYVYDSYGNDPDGASGETVVNPYRFTGRELDTETGLYYFRARYYDSSIGRFISEDPLQLNAGMNFQEYSYNNPVNFKDPGGLQPAPAYVPPPATFTVITGGGVATTGGVVGGVVAATVGLIVLDVGLLGYDVYQGYNLARAYGYFKPKPSAAGQTSGLECKKEKNDDDGCDEMYAEDTALCNKLGSRACHAQAAERYAACLAGRPIPPFPWRTPLRVK